MSLLARYRKLEPHLQTDLVGPASSTALRQLLMEEIAALRSELSQLSVPADLTTEKAIAFCLDYRRRREQLLWTEEFSTTLDTCRSDFLKRQE